MDKARTACDEVTPLIDDRKKARPGRGGGVLKPEESLFLGTSTVLILRKTGKEGQDDQVLSRMSVCCIRDERGMI